MNREEFLGVKGPGLRVLPPSGLKGAAASTTLPEQSSSLPRRKEVLSFDRAFYRGRVPEICEGEQ